MQFVLGGNVVSEHPTRYDDTVTRIRDNAHVLYNDVTYAPKLCPVYEPGDRPVLI